MGKSYLESPHLMLPHPDAVGLAEGAGEVIFNQLKRRGLRAAGLASGRRPGSAQDQGDRLE